MILINSIEAINFNDIVQQISWIFNRYISEATNTQNPHQIHNKTTLKTGLSKGINHSLCDVENKFHIVIYYHKNNVDVYTWICRNQYSTRCKTYGAYHASCIRMRTQHEVQYISLNVTLYTTHKHIYIYIHRIPFVRSSR